MRHPVLELAPIPSAPIPIPKEWTDYNGHLNMGFYMVAFDKGADTAYNAIGMGEAYIDDGQYTFMAVEAHICYLREMMPPGPLVVHSRVLDVDDKRAHFFLEMRHGTEGWLAATNEVMNLNVSQVTRRAAPWPPAILEVLMALKERHAVLPWPERAGRRIGIPRKA